MIAQKRGVCCVAHICFQIDQRRSFISQNTLLHSFAYEVPFQRSGKVGQASAADQFIRRTILTTDAVFPFLLKVCSPVRFFPSYAHVKLIFWTANPRSVS